MSTTAPIAPWLLCLWQARAVGASWWADLLLVLGVICLERLFPVERAKAWPELVRGWVSLIVTMYVMGVLYGHMWNGRALIPILLCSAVWWLLDYPEENIQRLNLIFNVLGLALSIWCVCSGPTAHPAPLWNNWIGWFHLALATHHLIVGGGQRSPTSKKNKESTTKIWRIGCALCTCILLSIYPEPRLETQSVGLLFIIPSLCIHNKQLITQCITPILETMYHPGTISPLLLQTTSVMCNRLLKQQKQETLFYLTAWSIALGLASIMNPWILLGAMLLGFLMSLQRRQMANSRKTETEPSAGKNEAHPHVIKIDPSILSISCHGSKPSSYRNHHNC